MNAPPVPPSGDDSPQKPADLSHFKRTQTTEEDVPHKKRGVDIGGALSSAVSSAAEGIKKARPQKTGGMSAKRKKYAVLAVAAVVFVPVIIAVVIGIPGQIVRSKAFAAYEEGRHEEALREFRDYLQNNPGDVEAVLYAARAAIRIGEYQYAAGALNGVAGAPEAAGNPDFLFYRALALTPDAEAVQSLNKLVSVAPDHTGGRLLRGALLVREREFQRAREDFLRADSVIRGDPAHDNAAMLEVNARVSSLPEMLPFFDLPPAADSAAPVMRRLSVLLDIPAAPGAYINRYLPALPRADETAEISDDNLAGIYYTLLLLADNQTDEALAQFSGLSPSVMTASPAGSLRGIQYALVGDYAAAADTFRALSDELPPRPEILFNLANATFGAAPTEDAARTAEKILSQAIEMAPDMSAALHNRAALRLWLGDFAGAGEDLAAMNEDAAPQTPLLRALAALALNPRDKSVGEILSAAEESPETTYIRAAHLTADGDHENALSLLQRAADETGQWDAANRLYARRLADAGLWMRARNALLSRAPQNSPEIRGEIALLDLQSGDISAAEAILAEMKEQGESVHSAGLESLILWQKGEAEAAQAAIEDALQKAEIAGGGMQIALAAADLLLQNSPEVLREILEREDTRGADAQAVLARLLAEEDPENAAAMAREAAARYPFSNVQRHAGVALAAAGKTEEAIDLLRAAAEWAPVNIQILSRLRELYKTAERNEDEARAALITENIKRHFGKGGEKDEHDEVLTVEVPANKESVRAFKLVNAAKTPDNIEAMLILFAKFLQGAEGAKQAALLFQRGTFWLFIGDPGKCEEDMREAVSIGLPPEQERRAELYLGQALVSQKKFAAAGEVYRRLAEKHPETPLYRRLAGGAMSDGGAHGPATDYLEETVRMFPADLESYFTLAAAFRQAQQTSNAVAVLRKAARIAPLYVPIYVELSRAQQITDIAAAKENSVIANDLSAR